MDENNLDNEDVRIEEIYDMISKMKNDIKSINKNSKKSIMSIELLKEEIKKSGEQNFKLKKELEEKKYNEIKIYKKIINLLDLIDRIYDSVQDMEDEEFIYNLNIIKKIIRKEMNEIDLIEIKSLGEFFNPDIHKCIAVEKNNFKDYNQIISVIERGYMLRGRVIRPASVIIAR